jgi:uncharacterized protein YdeI (BOF family)
VNNPDFSELGQEDFMRSSIGFQQTLVLGSTLLLLAVACNSCSGASSNSSSNSPMNMAGNWTLTATSAKGQGTFSGTADVAQSGTGIGTNGATTLTAVVGSLSVSQSGTSLTGTLTNSINGNIYSFTGTLSAGNITITGSTPCLDGTGTTSISITGTITSSSMQGNYTIMRSAGCYNPNDVGTWTVTKQ